MERRWERGGGRRERARYSCCFSCTLVRPILWQRVVLAVVREVRVEERDFSFWEREPRAMWWRLRRERVGV